MASIPTSKCAYLLTPRPVENPKLRLFCFAYAGGGATAFHPWAKSMPEGVELSAISLPGRAFRLRERAFTRMTSLVDTLASELKPYLDVPFVFYGHSLGALVAFELARKLRRLGAPQPKKLILSGRKAAHLPRTGITLHTLPQGEFIQEIVKFGGTPKVVLENKELLDMVVPALRSDFEMLETYNFALEPPLEMPIVAMAGLSDDKATMSEVDMWRIHTSSDFELLSFPGGHFFIHEKQNTVVPALVAHLN